MEERQSELLGEKTIIRKSFSNDKREVTCVAMVADEIDAHGDLFTIECVENAAYDFLSTYNISKEIGLQHSGERPDIDLIGSWFTDAGGSFDGVDAPVNSWIVKFRINDDDVWQRVKDGELTGVSIEGPASGYRVNEDDPTET